MSESNFKTLLRKIEDMDARHKSDIDSLRDDLKPIIDTYTTFVTGKNLLVGFGSAVIAIGAIGAGVTHLIKSIIN